MEKKDHVMSVRMTREMHDRLAAAAKADRRTMAQYLMLVLEHHLDDLDRKRTTKKSSWKSD